MQFEFAAAKRIIFGQGTLQSAVPLVAELGRRPMIVTGRDPVSMAPFLDRLQALRLEPLVFEVLGEPEIATVSQGIRQALEAECDMVIGFGGGSALDAGKAIAIMMTNPGELLDYLEVIGHGRLFERASARYAAIPTTAGTGSEVTRNAVLFSPEHGIKVSLRSPFMLPCLAIVDPDTTISLPPSLTAQTGLDALTQLIEPYVCSRSNPMVDALCRDGIRRVAASLRRAYETGSNATARTDMALASMFGGMALANAGLGAVHGLAAPLGGLTRAPHGAICARLLPFVMETNIRALESRAPASPALARYDEVAQLLLGDANAKRGDGVKWVFEICAVLAIQPLAHYGLTKNQVPAIVAQAQKASSMKANPILLTDQELTAILMQAID